jgi:hypothetical protein
MADSSAPEEYLNIEVRPAEAISRRVTILGSLVARFSVDAAHRAGVLGREEAEEIAFDLRAAVTLADADDDLTENERRILDTQVGLLDPNTSDDALWSVAALAAIGNTVTGDAPPADPMLSLGDALIEKMMEQDPTQSAAPGVYASMDEARVSRSREFAELWHWRLLTEIERRGAPDAGRQEIDLAIAEVVDETIASGFIEQGAVADFPGGEIPIRDWPEEELALQALAAEAGLHALNWLCGFGDTWDQTPLEV